MKRTPSIHPAPKPKPRTPKKPQFSSIKRPDYKDAIVAARRLRSTTPPKKKSRKPSEFARIYGSKERVAWVKQRPCAARAFGCGGPIENAHSANGGVGRKADARFILPLCRNHHRSLHSWGRNTFESWTNCHLETAAAKTELAWQARAMAGKS